MPLQPGRKSRDLTCRVGHPRHHSQALAVSAAPNGVPALWFAAVVALYLCGAHSAYGADVPLGAPEEPVPAEPSKWALQITPYIWATGINAHIAPFQRGPTIGVEKTFSDIMKDLRFGGFINVWGRYDRFVFSGDLMYVDLADSHNTGPLPELRLPGTAIVIPAGADIDFKLDTTLFTSTLMGGYRVFDTSQFTLDALGGARFWSVSNNAKIHGSLGGLNGTVHYKESLEWVDPVVGLRAFVPLTENLSLQGEADIGGFGAGSNFTWSALATVNYVFSDHLSASAGYKALGVDYEDDGHVFNARFHGPILGMTYRF